ncbi:MAG: hypothetical protein LAT80_08370 [Balneolaceae bacterium]|nr:hypothetical protein [Balneolaceae bacterium]
MIEPLSKADRQLGRLDMYSEYIPNIELFVSIHITKEATQSSKIEESFAKDRTGLADQPYLMLHLCLQFMKIFQN